MKPLKIYILLFFLLFTTILPTFAKEDFNATVDNVEALKTAITTLQDTGGTITITKNLVLDNEDGVFEPTEKITLNLEENTLFIKGNWQVKNIQVTGTKNPLVLNEKAQLHLIQSTLQVVGDNSIAIKLNANSNLLLNETKVSILGTRGLGIHAEESASVSLNTSTLNLSGDYSVALHTAGPTILFFSTITVEGTEALAFTENTPIQMYYSNTTPAIESALQKNEAVVSNIPKYQYLTLGQTPRLPKTLNYCLPSETAFPYTMPFEITWNTDALQINGSGLYPLFYTLESKSALSQTLLNKIKERPFYLAVIDPTVPFMYYKAEALPQSSDYAIGLKFYQAVQNFGSPKLWVEKDNSGHWEALSSENIKVDTTSQNSLILSGFESGHHYTFQLEANGALQGLSNSISLWLDPNGAPQISDSKASHNHNSCLPDATLKEITTNPVTDEPVYTVLEKNTSMTAPTEVPSSPTTTPQVSDMGNSLKTVLSYLTDTTKSNNVNTGIPALEGRAASFLHNIPVLLALSLIMLSTVLMILIPKK